MFSKPFVVVDDLKNLAVQRSYWEVQDDLHGIENWVIQNKMEMTIDKCAYLKFSSWDQQLKLMERDLANCWSVKDLKIHLSADLL